MMIPSAWARQTSVTSRGWGRATALAVRPTRRTCLHLYDGQLGRRYSSNVGTQKALLLPKTGASFTLGTAEIPKPGPSEVLVRLEASALNPLDVRIQASGFFAVKTYPAVIGEDGAGVVQTVGDDVTHLAPGDRVCFQARMGNKYATFQEYCLANAALATKIPSSLSFDQAASISVAFNPFAVATYAPPPRGIALTPPFEPGGLGKYAGRPIVIFGGAGSVGQQAIQLAKLSGFSPIVTTASFHNQDWLLSLGATHVLDRRLDSVALKEAVRRLVGVPLTYIFDAVSVRETQCVAYDLLSPGGTLAIVGQPQVGGGEGSSNGSDAGADDGKKVLTVIGTFHAPSYRALGAQFSIALTRWLEEGKIKPNHHIEVLHGGLDGVAGGLERLAGGVSATKLIVRPRET